MQGALLPSHNVTTPITGPDSTEWAAWNSGLPQIGRTSHAVDQWREIDAMQYTDKRIEQEE